MKRCFQGLAATAADGNKIPDGVFLVRVDQVRYARERQKASYAVRFSVIEPIPWAGRTFSSRLYCTQKALWKLSWFLRDFGYDPELLARDEVEEKGLVGLRRLSGRGTSGERQPEGALVLDAALLPLSSRSPEGGIPFCCIRHKYLARGQTSIPELWNLESITVISGARLRIDAFAASVC